MRKVLGKKERLDAFSEFVAQWQISRAEIEEFTESLFPTEVLPVKVLYKDGTLTRSLLRRKVPLALDVHGVRIPVRQSFQSVPYMSAGKQAKSLSFAGKPCHLLTENEWQLISPEWDNIWKTWKKLFGYSLCVSSVWVQSKNVRSPTAVRTDTGAPKVVYASELHRVISVMHY